LHQNQTRSQKPLIFGRKHQFPRRNAQKSTQKCTKIHAKMDVFSWSFSTRNAAVLPFSTRRAYREAPNSIQGGAKMRNESVSISVNFQRTLGYVARGGQIPSCGVTALSLAGLRRRVARMHPGCALVFAMSKAARSEAAHRRALGQAWGV